MPLPLGVGRTEWFMHQRSDSHAADEITRENSRLRVAWPALWRTRSMTRAARTSLWLREAVAAAPPTMEASSDAPAMTEAQPVTPPSALKPLEHVPRGALQQHTTA